MSNPTNNSDKVFYFFIENEFFCRPNVNLLEDNCLIYTSQAITINLINFTSKGIGEVYKIYEKVPTSGYNEEQMVELYKKTGEYVNSNFINGDRNKVFIGCARDDNGTHMNCTKMNLNFNCRTDPIHDIFNIMKHIYLSKLINFNGSLTISYPDLRELLPSFYDSIPIVEYYNLNNEYIGNKDQRIWIPDIDRPLHYFMEPIKYLFTINYYEKLNEKVSDDKNQAKGLLKFILLLKDIFNFVQEKIIDSITVEEYRGYYEELSQYSFHISRIRCLTSLKGTMQTNIKFFDEFEVPFKPIWFSTLMIEAEKGRLRYEACNELPSEDQCKKWFKSPEFRHQCKCTNAFSEFGNCDLKFDPLPKEIKPMNLDPVEDKELHLSQMCIESSSQEMQ